MTVKELEYKLEDYICNGLGWRNEGLSREDIINSKLNNIKIPSYTICFHYPYFFNSASFNDIKGIKYDNLKLKNILKDNWFDYPITYDSYLVDRLKHIFIEYFKNRYVGPELNIWFSNYITNAHDFARKYGLTYNSLINDIYLSIVL